jgi:hypothetical protein
VESIEVAGVSGKNASIKRFCFRKDPALMRSNGLVE